MTYCIQGLDPASFAHLVGQSDQALAKEGAVRVRATGPGYPCRITLEDAEFGESLILLNFVSHDVATPYRSAYAIFVREGAAKPACFIDELPPVMRTRPLGLRGFDRHGNLKDARLALPGDADNQIRQLFRNEEITEIHAHNAAHGCFSAKVVRT